MGRSRRGKKDRNGENKAKKRQYDGYETGDDEKEDEAAENTMIQRRIQKVFSQADNYAKYMSRTAGKFNYEWCDLLTKQCMGFPFSNLAIAFRERYGVNNLNQDLRVFHDRGEGSHNTLTLVKSVGEREGEDINPYLDSNSMEEILARLPLLSLMRAKIVCKAWNRAIGSLLPVNVDTDHYFVTHHISNGCHCIALFSSSLNRWFRIPLQWTKPWIWNCCEVSSCPEITLCAAGGGLYFFLDWYSGPVVFNPLANQHRVLPDIPLKDGWRPGMAVELIAETDHFKVIAIPVYDEVNWFVDPLLYNSSTNKWTVIPVTGDNPTTDIYWSDSHPWRSTLHNGTVYCTNSFGHHLGCYDIASGEFKFLEIEEGFTPQIDCHDHGMNYDPALPALLVCSGKLILVGRLQRRAGEGSILGRLPLIKHTLVGVWELDISAKIKRWSLISVTPRDLLEDTVKSSDGTDFVVGASAQGDQIWLMLRGSMTMLSFNVKSMEWTVMPGCPAEDRIDTISRRAFFAPLRVTPYI
ncbi:hypothetical protein KI387_030650 [Taxus chinensis]|uniref:F-box domain-containing protein n=1 Tax=Taxus chinensis TaxID=29808 RepID=A0AA38CLY2_TAXCH|nr:hypothetical protein KI387_030650 [Taxus chinensis]